MIGIISALPVLIVILIIILKKESKKALKLAALDNHIDIDM